MYDLLLKNGTIYDGTGAAPYRSDIGIVQGRIAAIGTLEEDSARTVDVTGLAVSPGFIDLHTHSDFSFLLDNSAQSKVRQGCTLELTGNCGSSFCAPLHGESRRVGEERVGLYGVGPIMDWTTFDEYLAKLEIAGSTLNLATQVGHGTVRTAVLGFEDRAPTPEELDRMRGLVAESLDAGALGFSTGLYYAPGSYARTDEVVTLAREAARRGKLYSTHMRDEGDSTISLFGSIEETLAISRLSGVRVQISHLKCAAPSVWGRTLELLDRLDRGRAEGLDVAADQYPYTASSTGLSGAILPRWAQVGGREATLARLADEEFYTRLHEEIKAGFQSRGGADHIVVANHPPDRGLEGLNLEQIAQNMGCDAADAGIRIYQAAETSVISHSLREEDVVSIAAGSLVAVGSDGSSLSTEGVLSAGKPHPRSYGTFPRFLSRYVREQKVVSLEEAIRKMTMLPASRLGLTQRGRIAPGMWADLVAFDPDTVADTATYDAPHSYPVGIPHVVVNGELVIQDGAYTAATPGKVLKRFDD
ncbi:MAG: D-aminoacylase [Chloroflexi bacterium]|nr:D-aminoacylase [Chloroflexota bacterium]